MGGREGRLTPSGVSEESSSCLRPEDFVIKPTPEPNEPGLSHELRFELPRVEIPAGRMGKEEAEKAKAALEVCQKIMGEFYLAGLKKIGTPEFQEAAREFKEATGGVDILDVVGEVLRVDCEENSTFPSSNLLGPLF